eukprot:353465-Chlamydomonas_euryale.AAC.6
MEVSRLCATQIEVSLLFAARCEVTLFCATRFQVSLLHLPTHSPVCVGRQLDCSHCYWTAHWTSHWSVWGDRGEENAASWIRSRLATICVPGQRVKRCLLDRQHGARTRVRRPPAR